VVEVEVGVGVGVVGPPSRRSYWPGHARAGLRPSLRVRLGSGRGSWAGGGWCWAVHGALLLGG
jgi:hypothetical protein